jgi:hypothetical protein
MAARSVSYPRENLEKTLDFVREIHAHAGSSSYLNRESLAEIIKKSTASELASAAAHYGLFELKVSVGYKITPLFKRIEKPTNPSEQKVAILEALRNPKVYTQLLSRFSGERVPSSQFLENILSREFAIQEAAAPRAAKIFLENLHFAGVLFNGLLLLESQSPISEPSIEQNAPIQLNENPKNSHIEAEIRESNESYSDAEANHSKSASHKQAGHRVIEVMLNWDRYAKISLPSDPTQEEFLIISEELQRLEKRLFPQKPK